MGYWVGNPGTLPANGLTITGCRVRDTHTYATDGINLNNGTKNSTVTQCNFRNTGDDGLASWSQSSSPANTNNLFSFNTVQMPLAGQLHRHLRRQWQQN